MRMIIRSAFVLGALCAAPVIAMADPTTKDAKDTATDAKKDAKDTATDTNHKAKEDRKSTRLNSSHVD